MPERNTSEYRGIPKGNAAVTNNGIRNPKGLNRGLISLAFLGLIPVTNFLARTETLHWVLRRTVSLIPGCAAAGAHLVASGRAIPALSALYLFATYGASGALSVAGQSMARPEGVDPSHPRAHLDALEGLPLRLRSAHYGLLENFPAFALAAALAQTLSPGDPHVVGLLGLHVVAKVFVYYPAYLADVPIVRGLSHVLATSAVINVCWRLATAAAGTAA
ncbi:hypothetical protein PG987_006198 [Apiospora arundinis]